MRRVGGKSGACAGMFIALSLHACSSAGDSNAMSSGTQATPPEAQSPISSASAGAAIPAADSGGPANSSTTSVAAVPPSTAGRAGMAAGSGGAPGTLASGGAGADASASAGGAGSAAIASAAGAPAAIGGMGGAGVMASEAFILTPVDFPMAGDELTFPQTANPPTNQSPEFTWTGVPADAQSLALAFRDLGNSAVKWIIWDMPPSLMHIPPNIMPVAMPSEVPGSAQLGSLTNQGYAGPGSGARQYDFTLWALDTDKLPVTARMTTVQIHELLEEHELVKTPPVLVRNTRNL